MPIAAEVVMMKAAEAAAHIFSFFYDSCPFIRLFVRLLWRRDMGRRLRRPIHITILGGNPAADDQRDWRPG